MKKNLLLLASLLVLLLVPALMVSAEETTITPTLEITGETKSEDNNRTLNVTLSDTSVGITKAVVTFTYGNAISNFKCKAADGWSVTQTDGSQSAVCTYTSTTAKTGTPITIGTIEYYNDNGSGKDCEVTAKISVEGNSNPTTGAELPYVILISGVALAGVAYLSTSKKSKIHNI